MHPLNNLKQSGIHASCKIVNQIECDTKKKGERWKKEKCHAKGQKLKVKLKSAA